MTSTRGGQPSDLRRRTQPGGGDDLVLPRRWAAALAALVPAAHAFGVAGWCLFLFPQPWWPLACVGAALAVSWAFAWRWGWRAPAAILEADG